MATETRLFPYEIRNNYDCEEISTTSTSSTVNMLTGGQIQYILPSVPEKKYIISFDYTTDITELQTAVRSYDSTDVSTTSPLGGFLNIESGTHHYERELPIPIPSDSVQVVLFFGGSANSGGTLTISNLSFTEVTDRTNGVFMAFKNNSAFAVSNYTDYVPTIISISQDVTGTNPAYSDSSGVLHVKTLYSTYDELIAGETPKIYGFAVDETVSDPVNAVTYIEDSAGFTPATMTDGVFNGGSWLDVYPFNSVKPCRFNSSGTVGYYVSPNDFGKKEDGVTDAEKTLRIMIEIPPVYWKFTKTTNGYEVRFSDTQVDSSYQALAHSRGDVLKGNLYVGAYEGCIAGTLRSGSDRTPTVSTTLSDFRIAATSEGDGFELMNFHTWTLLQILFVAMFKSLDSQSALGNGIVNASGISNTGTLDTVGMYYGTTADQTTGVKFMGIENIFGNTNTFLDGIATGDQVMISDNTIFNSDGTNYLYTIDNSSVSSGFGYMTKAVGANIGGFLPVSSNSTATTNYCDITSQISGWYSNLRVGGSYTNTTESGIFCIYLSSIDEAHAKTGARLQYLAP